MGPKRREVSALSAISSAKRRNELVPPDPSMEPVTRTPVQDEMCLSPKRKGKLLVNSDGSEIQPECAAKSNRTNSRTNLRSKAVKEKGSDTGTKNNGLLEDTKRTRGGKKAVAESSVTDCKEQKPTEAVGRRTRSRAIKETKGKLVEEKQPRRIGADKIIPGTVEEKFDVRSTSRNAKARETQTKTVERGVSSVIKTRSSSRSKAAEQLDQKRTEVKGGKGVENNVPVNVQKPKRGRAAKNLNAALKDATLPTKNSNMKRKLSTTTECDDDKPEAAEANDLTDTKRPAGRKRLKKDAPTANKQHPDGDGHENPEMRTTKRTGRAKSSSKKAANSVQDSEGEMQLNNLSNKAVNKVKSTCTVENEDGLTLDIENKAKSGKKPSKNLEDAAKIQSIKHQREVESKPKTSANKKPKCLKADEISSLLNDDELDSDYFDLDDDPEIEFNKTETKVVNLSKVLVYQQPIAKPIPVIESGKVRKVKNKNRVANITSENVYDVEAYGVDEWGAAEENKTTKKRKKVAAKKTVCRSRKPKVSRAPVVGPSDKIKVNSKHIERELGEAAPVIVSSISPLSPKPMEVGGSEPQLAMIQTGVSLSNDCDEFLPSEVGHHDDDYQNDSEPAENVEDTGQKSYKTPAIPARVTSKVQQGKASTPRLVEEVKEFSKQEEIQRCFGFDDSQSESEDNSYNMSCGSILAGISPVQKTTTSVLSLGTTRNTSILSPVKTSSLGAKPARFMLPGWSRPFSRHQSTCLSLKSSLLSPKTSNNSFVVPKLPLPSTITSQNKESALGNGKAKTADGPVGSAKIREEADQGQKDAFKILKDNSMEAKVKASRSKVMEKKTVKKSPKTKQSLVYETVGQDKRVKSRISKPRKEFESVLFSDDEVREEEGKPNKLQKRNLEEESGDPQKRKVSRNVYASRTTSSKVSTVPNKRTKKACKAMEAWETLQSSHFEDIEDVELSFM